MIYSMYFAAMHERAVFRTNWETGETQAINAFEGLLDLMKNTNHTVLIILTRSQEPIWEEKATKYKLKEFIHYDMGTWVTNPVHPTVKRNLRLIALKGTGNEN